MPFLLGGADQMDVIDVSQLHQQMDKFGASDAWTMQKIGAWSEAAKNQVADLLFSTNKGITDANENLKAHPTIDFTTGFDIPPRAIVTLVGE